MNHGEGIDLGAFGNLFEQLAVVAELGHQIDQRLARLAAERSLISEVRTSEFRSLAMRYLGPAALRDPDLEMLIKSGYYTSPKGMVLPFFDRLVAVHMQEGQFDPDRTLLRALTYRNPLDIETITRIADTVGPWLRTAVASGGFALIMKTMFGSGPEERATARLKRAQAETVEHGNAQLRLPEAKGIENLVRTQLHEAEPSLDVPPFSQTELRALEELAKLDFSVSTSKLDLDLETAVSE
jgi:hypothetical protein